MSEFIFTREHLSQAHFIIDYDGTLIPLVTTLEEGLLPNSTRDLLLRLRERFQLEISILSGRPLEFLMKQFEGTEVFLAGSHGAEFYNYKSKQTKSLVVGDRSKGIDRYHQFFGDLVKKYANSFIETKPFGVAIHYGNCSDSSSTQIEHMLSSYVAANKEQILGDGLIYFKGKNVLEVKYQECNKGYYLNTFKEQTGLHVEKIFGFGDDENDENVFREINKLKLGFTFRIGRAQHSVAKFKLVSQVEAIDVLSKFLEIK